MMEVSTPQPTALQARLSKRRRVMAGSGVTTGSPSSVCFKDFCAESPVIGRDDVHTTLPGGERIYLSFSDGDTEPEAAPAALLREAERAAAGRHMLGRPIAQLMTSVVRAEVEREERRVEQAATEGGADDPMAEEGSAAPKTALLVDKYAPRSFSQLVSDERTNREVLKWLKQWDGMVFGRPTTVGTGDFKKTVQRPEQQVLLLSGPPGCGKTTLAHVAARHCGYQTMEVNSSDDRSAKVVRQKIVDAME